MDLAGMINDGAEASHRGSVDKTGSAPPTPVLDTRSSSIADSESASETAVQSPDTHHQRPRQNGSGRQRGQIPRWAHIYKGRNNKVRDPRRWKSSETRPELTNMFDDDVQAPSAPQPAVAAPSAAADVEPQAAPSSAALPPSPFRPFPIPATAASDIGPGGNLSLTGLSASMAGLIPNDDQTKVSAGWLFERIEKITDREQSRFIEVEFKMGTIADDNDSRHRFPTSSEAVIDPIYWRQHNSKFKTAINERSFRSSETSCDSIEVANAANDRNTVLRSNQLSTDEMFQVQCDDISTTGKTRVRVSRDDRGRIIECIHKERVGDIFSSSPNTPFDLKMSMSSETPVNYERIVAPQIQGVTPSFVRDKNRSKWVSRGCTVDLTSVHSKGVAGMPPQVVKEGEIEANMELLGNVSQEYRGGRNKAESSDKFLEVIRYTVDSARFLLRNI